MAPQANFFGGFSIENMIIECKHVKKFACGALECGRSSKNLIKPLIFFGVGGIYKTPPLIEYRSELGGGSYK